MSEPIQSCGSFNSREAFKSSHINTHTLNELHTTAFTQWRQRRRTGETSPKLLISPSQVKFDRCMCEKSYPLLKLLAYDLDLQKHRLIFLKSLTIPKQLAMRWAVPSKCRDSQVALKDLPMRKTPSLHRKDVRQRTVGTTLSVVGILESNIVFLACNSPFKSFAWYPERKPCR